MSLYRCISIMLGCFLFLARCAPEEQIIPFAFDHHSLKIQYDPVSLDLACIDTMTIQYHRNVDQIYFFLHKSLSVERVGVGHQDFDLGEMRRGELEQVYRDLDKEWQEIVQVCQIVTVHIPKSLYSERIEVRYRGKVDLAVDSPVVWHPALPDSPSTFSLTALIPRDYVCIVPGQKGEIVDGDWRLNRCNVHERQTFCKIQVMPAI